MRITNKIMQNNSLYNINNNKVLQDKLSNQMSTQQKLTRPSDDPVVAIRALRLRTSVSEITQYYSKNAPDAEEWLKVTSDALGTVTDVLTDMIKQATKGANKDLGSEDLAIITEQLKSLRDEFYSTGNVDYAGRYVFTGYRTDTPMSFNSEVEKQNLSYSITEQTDITKFDTINYTNIGNLDGLTVSNYNDTTHAAITEQDISNLDIHRLQLSYDDTATGTKPTIKKVTETTDASGNKIKVETDLIAADKITEVSVDAATDPYQTIEAANKAGTEAVVYVPETGELLFSDEAYKKVSEDADVKAGAEIRVSYTKDDWKNGDLRPENYFVCTSTETVNGTAQKPIEYNQDYLTANPTDQVIEYDVGYNQTIRVNTKADEVFTTDLDRTIDNLENSLSTLTTLESTMADLKNLIDKTDESSTDYTTLQTQYDAAQKAYTYIRDQVNNTFSSSITSLQKNLDATNVAITDNGTRSKRLDLISNRLMSQKTTYETLQHDNESADISEVAIQLTSAELTYNAALMATGKIMQSTLMNYI